MKIAKITWQFRIFRHFRVPTDQGRAQIQRGRGAGDAAGARGGVVRALLGNGGNRGRPGSPECHEESGAKVKIDFWTFSASPHRLE